MKNVDYFSIFISNINCNSDVEAVAEVSGIGGIAKYLGEQLKNLE